jgi:hypothetical protein
VHRVCCLTICGTMRPSDDLLKLCSHASNASVLVTLHGSNKRVQVKRESYYMSAWQHVKHVATALAVPLVVECLRIVAVGAISLWISFGRTRTKRLEQQKQGILKELKVGVAGIMASGGCSHVVLPPDCRPVAEACYGPESTSIASTQACVPIMHTSAHLRGSSPQNVLKHMQDATNYERIQKIIEQYDPSERAKIKARAAALASPSSGGRRSQAGGIKPVPSPMRVRACCAGTSLQPLVQLLMFYKQGSKANSGRSLPKNGKSQEDCGML